MAVIQERFVALKMPPFVAGRWKGGEVRADFLPFFFSFTSFLKKKKNYHLHIFVHVSTPLPTHDAETERKNKATKMSSSYVTFAHGLVLVFVQNELNQTTLAAGNPDQNERED